MISDRSEFDNNITMIPITTARHWCILHDILIVQAFMNQLYSLNQFRRGRRIKRRSRHNVQSSWIKLISRIILHALHIIALLPLYTMYLIIFIFRIEYLRLLINSIYLNKFVYIVKREKFRDVFINIVDCLHLV